jgi:HupE / UreJ protein
MRRPFRRVAATIAASVALAAAAIMPSAANAHSLTSSTIAVRVDDDDRAAATISVAEETLEQALGTTDLTDAEVIVYLDEHLTVTGTDGTSWGERYGTVEHETVEGIDSISVDVTFDPSAAGIARFTVDYDAIVEAIPTHEAVVVLTDSAGEISSPGVITDTASTLLIADGTQAVPVADMLRYGFEHVLEGADHLLFLLTLLLVAPVVVVAGRWQRNGGLMTTVGRVVRVVTAFTLGHSITLIAAALGWVNVPSRPVEILIAASVGVAAIHAIRPLTARGAAVIAVGFGLVHGLAFAGILSDLGLSGTTSVLALLAFNLGIELAQLVTVALMLPSLYILSRTRAYPTVRASVAGLALTAATGWAMDRAGVLANPGAGIENFAISNPEVIVFGFAAIAVGAWCVEMTLRRRTSVLAAAASRSPWFGRAH